MPKKYEIERAGQIDFFDNYGIPYHDEPVLIDNTDGVYNGCLFEFKLNIQNLSKTLFQAIKYLSRMRIKGESIPATILLIDLNNTKAYIYKSEDYRDDIQQVYTGAASKGNESFAKSVTPIETLDYSQMIDSAKLKHLIKDAKFGTALYMPVDIDENCIVGWAERYYRENPNAKKGDFIGDETGSAVKITGEIREPKHFKGLINPYKGKTNERFKYLMDCLNDRLSKKDLGAFYTPEPYARKAAELVQMAVDRVPEGNDYIILDRCAGTGNLEEALIGLTDRNGDALIGHCVVSTFEYYEYKVLQERIGDKVRDIIPPTEADVVYANGVVANADAMSKEYIENPIIRQYVDDPKCTIILFENPPYSDPTGITHNEETGKRTTGKTVSYIAEEFRKNMMLKSMGSQQATSRDLANLFIWSGFYYYIRQESDAYVVFSPVKYFKNIGLAKKEFLAGFAFNRKHFHATESVISCILWSGKDDVTTKRWELPAYDIVKKELVLCKNIIVQYCRNSIQQFSDKSLPAKYVETNFACDTDGTIRTGWFYKKGRKPLYSEEIIGYACFNRFIPGVINYNLVRCNLWKGLEASYGFHMRKENYLKMLPCLCSKLFPQDDWYDKDVYFTTSDGGDAYTKDPQFLKSCLIYTCLSNQNKCLSFDGSDGRRYQNELCFDNDTLALKDLNKYAADKKTALDDDENALMELWYKILEEARRTANYNPEFNYGVYQITKELNTFHEFGTGKSKKKVYDYPELNGNLDVLRTLLKAYYKSHITDKMFQYELLK